LTQLEISLPGVHAFSISTLARVQAMTLPVVQFMTVFQKVKVRTKGNPQDLSRLCQNDDGLASLASELNHLATSIARELVTQRERYVLDSSPEFIAAYREYLRDYEDAVEPIAANKDKQFLSEIGKLLQEDPERVRNAFRKIGVDIDLDAPDDFDPLKDDPVNSFELMVRVVESMASVPDESRDDFSDQMYKAVGAWLFFQNTIGIDLAGIYQRWKATPVTFVPRHVSNRHGLTEPGSLYDTLRQAHRAYVFGSERAAMALCRALMELVLKKHWGIEEDEAYINAKQKNSGRDPGLQKIIAIAETRYDTKYKLREHGLRQQKELADDVLHGKGPPRNVSGGEVFQFLKTLRYLIESAPRLAGK